MKHLNTREAGALVVSSGLNASTHFHCVRLSRRGDHRATCTEERVSCADNTDKLNERTRPSVSEGGNEARGLPFGAIIDMAGTRRRSIQKTRAVVKQPQSAVALVSLVCRSPLSDGLAVTHYVSPRHLSFVSLQRQRHMCLVLSTSV